MRRKEHKRCRLGLLRFASRQAMTSGEGLRRIFSARNQPFVGIEPFLNVRPAVFVVYERTRADCILRKKQRNFPFRRLITLHTFPPYPHWLNI